VKQGMLIYGAGAWGEMVAELFGDYMPVVGFVDDHKKQGSEVGAFEVVGNAGALRGLAEDHEECFVAIGTNELREAVFARVEKAGFTIPSLVYPTALVSTSAKIGAGALVMPHAVVETGCTVGRGAIVNTGAVVCHHSEVGLFAHMAPGAKCGGHCMIGARALVGINAAVNRGLEILEDQVIPSGKAVFFQ